MKRLLTVFGIIVLAVVTSGGIVALVLSGVLPVPFGPMAEARAASEQARPAVTVMYAMKERVVNLADTGSPRYLKVQVTLEFIDQSRKEPPKGEAIKQQQEAFSKEIAAHSAILEDKLTMVFSSQHSSDLLTPQGKERLKQQLIDQVNAALHQQERVVNIYFTTFIIQ